jgi:pyruvate ferredoxin oxidoreductase beta subunit
MNVPCPSGWAFDPKDTVRLGQLAVETGVVVLYEIVGGELRLTGKSKSLAKTGLRPVSEYLGTQGRFRGITDETVEQIQAWVDVRWAEYVQRDAGICETF